MERQTTSLSGLISHSRETSKTYRPSFFRWKNEEDRRQLEKLFTQPGIMVFDELHSQVMELVKAQQPTRKFSNEALSEAADNYLNGIPSEEYGVWVYYPWLNRIVHLLDKDEFRAVRTNRNQYKITPEERDMLATQKIGILGLSVGQAVAVTLAMERCFGELRIADFDILELSNLNRIRAGVQDLGLLKTVSTARQIAEIDPYLNVVCYNDGVTEENIHRFFTEGGLLDMVLDECDGLDIKILVRLKARELGVPVIMETSDRGMVDVERFDLESDRPIMHGLIEHLDQNPENLKGLTNEQKIPYILPMLGLDTMSDRLKASMLEVEQSITTWPQLASDVVLGGAASTNVCRRMALGQFEYSGRFFVDLNEIIREENAYLFEPAEVAEVEETSVHPGLDLPFKRIPSNGQSELKHEEANILVEAAIWAPSGGNSQPWKWLYDDKTLYLFLDSARASSFLDYAAAGSYLSLGAATENLVLKAHQMGFEVKQIPFPDPDCPQLAMAFQFFKETAGNNTSFAAHDNDHLVEAIRIRLTNRLIRKRQNLPPHQVQELIHLVESVQGASLKVIQEDEQLNEIGKLIARTDRVLITNRNGHHGFVNEIRWNDESAALTKDGLDIATIDLTAGEAAGFRMAKNWSVIKTLNNWGGGSVFEKLSKKCVGGASAVGLITMPGSTSRDYFNAGVALERIWLYANRNTIAIQPMTGLPFLLHRMKNGGGEGLTEKNNKELIQLEARLVNLFALDKRQWPAFLVRFLIAEEPRVKSLRRPVEEVLHYKSTVK